MLTEKCPYCDKKLVLKDRLELIYKFNGTCKYCGHDYIPKTASHYFGEAIGGAVLGILLRAQTDFELFSIVILAVLFALVVHKITSLLYSLDRLDDY
ncbi:hypothetical protein [Aliidiomarina sp.]|uniref:hypothetical protein n=1 Tax=Aliidiomarina sp. TaxID=1872439 RepID=UPI003A4D6A23